MLFCRTQTDVVEGDACSLSNVFACEEVVVPAYWEFSQWHRIVDGDDLETAEMIEAGLHPTAQQVAANWRTLHWGVRLFEICSFPKD